MTYRIRPIAGTEAMFELLDEGGEVVAFGYEAPLRAALRENTYTLTEVQQMITRETDEANNLAARAIAKPYDGPCACNKSHTPPPPVAICPRHRLARPCPGHGEVYDNVDCADWRGSPVYVRHSPLCENVFCRGCGPQDGVKA